MLLCCISAAEAASEKFRHVVCIGIDGPVSFAVGDNCGIPWEMATGSRTLENANKFIRQYIPKGIDFRELTDGYIHSVQLKLNRRPGENQTSQPQRMNSSKICCNVALAS